ncbi:hypothetical protein C8R45DRAFT_1100674 [Mycena sanguinolenta]|nr:hypothetical protein C8R45DRAFT_1100674 [Mycena sanguinolenta]
MTGLPAEINLSKAREGGVDQSLGQTGSPGCSSRWKTISQAPGAGKFAGTEAAESWSSSPSRCARPQPQTPRTAVPESGFIPEYDGGTSDDVVMQNIESTRAADTDTPGPTDADSSNEGRPKRLIRLPAHFRDTPPEPLPPVDLAPCPEEPTSRLPHVVLIVWDTFTSFKNSFGLWRKYLHRPTYDPDSLIPLEHLSNQFCPPTVSDMPPAARVSAALATNQSEARIMSWYYNGNTLKSKGDLNTLIHDDKREFPLLADFEETSVQIEVLSGSATVLSRFFDVPGLYYRRIVSVIKAAFADPLSRHFHFAPFKLFHQIRSSAAQIRVFSELYNSDVFISEHDRIQRHGKVPDDDPHCTREKIIAALMWWSDLTHLANFGIAKLWPIYMLFGNLLKYIRAQPNSGAEHHVAYMSEISGWSYKMPV